jgi:hypothetical protein
MKRQPMVRIRARFVTRQRFLAATGNDQVIGMKSDLDRVLGYARKLDLDEYLLWRFIDIRARPPLTSGKDCALMDVPKLMEQPLHVLMVG